jgi:hypothetical protein
MNAFITGTVGLGFEAVKESTTNEEPACGRVAAALARAIYGVGFAMRIAFH